MMRFSFEAAMSEDVMAAVALLMPFVSNFNMEPATTKPPRRPRSPTAVNRRIPAILKSLLVKAPDYTLSVRQLQEALTEVGYSPTSASPGISLLKKEGLVTTDGTLVTLDADKLGRKIGEGLNVDRR